MVEDGSRKLEFRLLAKVLRGIRLPVRQGGRRTPKTDPFGEEEYADQAWLPDELEPFPSEAEPPPGAPPGKPAAERLHGEYPPAAEASRRPEPRSTAGSHLQAPASVPREQNGTPGERGEVAPGEQQGALETAPAFEAGGAEQGVSRRDAQTDTARGAEWGNEEAIPAVNGQERERGPAQAEGGEPSVDFSYTMDSEAFREKPPPQRPSALKPLFAAPPFRGEQVPASPLSFRAKNGVSSEPDTPVGGDGGPHEVRAAPHASRPQERIADTHAHAALPFPAPLKQRTTPDESAQETSGRPAGGVVRAEGDEVLPASREARPEGTPAIRRSPAQPRHPALGGAPGEPPRAPLRSEASPGTRTAKVRIGSINIHVTGRQRSEPEEWAEAPVYSDHLITEDWEWSCHYGR